MDRRSLGWLLFLASVTWHLWWVLAPPDAGDGPIRRTLGRDFATYYYAAEVALSGGDPWDTDALSAAAQKDGTRERVHPWFYPPPALVAVAWAPSVDLMLGYHIWYALQEIAFVMACLILAIWWRPLGTALPVVIAAWVALCWGLPYGLVMGQINPLVLCLVLAGLMAAERERPELGGALVGAACMVKMSPALFVAWWALHGRWRAVSAAGGTAIGLSLIAVGMVDYSTQLRFYTDVLPGFGSGDYNGLSIRIGMFANHSIPNLVDQVLPGDANRLSMSARLVSATLALALVGGLAWAFRHRERDTWSVAGQISAIAVAALLIPVYTYEHHLIQAIPAAVLVTMGLERGKLHRGWWLAAIVTAVALAWPHPHLKELASVAPPVIGWGLRELKPLALLLLLLGSARLGATPPGAPKPHPAESPAQRGA